MSLLPVGSSSHEIIGDSAVMRALLAKLPPAARARRTTLISGPTGTGKELVARALHALGQIPETPFVVVHCGAAPDTLVHESLVPNGHGATGHGDKRDGAHRAGVTVFLDEIESLSPRAQLGLLHFLGRGEHRNGDGQRAAWVLAATSEDLTVAVRNGRFRADLLYRLEAMRLDLPALRSRGSDIELLARHFLRSCTSANRSFTTRAINALQQHEWPGNVRELKHAVERAALLCDKQFIDAEDIGLSPRSGWGVAPQAATLEDGLWNLVERDGLSLAEAVTHCERTIIDAALRRENGNRTRAAERLHIHLRTIFKKLQRS